MIIGENLTFILKAIMVLSVTTVMLCVAVDQAEPRTVAELLTALILKV